MIIDKKMFIIKPKKCYLLLNPVDFVALSEDTYNGEVKIFTSVQELNDELGYDKIFFYRKTKFLNFENLRKQGQDAVTVIQLMMACNDLSLANEALAGWKENDSKMMKQRQIGAGMFFVRTQLAHLHEGFKVIDSIRKAESLTSLLRRCDNRTQESFRHLEEFLPDGSKRAEFERLVGRVRHNLTFHYDESGKLIERAIEDRASMPEFHR